MHKKPISFGKIKFNASKTGENSNKNEANTSGFGTFGRTPIQEHKEIEEIAEDLENQHVQQVMGIRNFGKKAKNFDVIELVEQAKLNAQEANKKRLEAEAAMPKPEAKKDEESDGDVIGPLPIEASKNADDEDEIGPPIPPDLLNKYNKTKKSKGDGEDSYDELSGSDDEDLPIEKRIPNSHEVRLYINFSTN